MLLWGDICLTSSFLYKEGIPISNNYNFLSKEKKRMVFFWLFLTPRLGIKACLVIIPLLGVTWLFGLLLPVHKAFAYIFTILNSTQVSVEWLLSKIIQSRLNFLTRRYNITIVTWYLLELWKQKAVKYARENRFLPHVWVTQFSFLLKFLFIHK